MSQKSFKSSTDVRRGRVVSSVAYEWRKQLLDLGRPHKKRAAVIDKVLEQLRDVNARRWLSPKAPGRIKRFLQGRQTPKEQEIADVRAAHARIAPKLMVANNEENRELAASFRAFVQAALVADPEFYGSEIETAREIARHLSDLVGAVRGPGGGD